MDMANLKKFLKSKKVRYVYFCLLLCTALFYLVRWYDDFVRILSIADIFQIILSCLACLGVTLVYFLIVQRIFTGVGSPLPFLVVLKITSLAQLGKYLPGKLMYPANFYLFSREEGVQAEKIALCFFLSAALSFLAGALCAAPVFFILAPSLRFLLVGCVVLLLIMIHPRMLALLLRFLPAKTSTKGDPGRVDLEGTGLNYAFLARITGMYLANWGLAGLALFFAMRAFGAADLHHYPVCLSAVALASTLGLIAFFAPAGIGVREAIGTLILSKIAPVEVAILAMLVIRVGFLLTDIGLGLLGMAVKRRSNV